MRARVILVDDHQMLRDGLRAIIDMTDEFEVVGEAFDGRSAIDLAAALRPDVVVMDVVMPGMNGIEATHRIVSENPKTKVVALSVYTDRRYVANMLEAGAAAYVLKVAAHGCLLDAIRTVLQGRTYLSPEVSGAASDLHAPGASGESAFRALGAREREVLQLVAEGRTSAEISHLLHISLKAVETHRHNIMRKLEIHRLANRVKYAIREGLTALDS
jgi:two-component system NarL family response regulator